MSIVFILFPPFLPAPNSSPATLLPLKFKAFSSLFIVTHTHTEFNLLSPFNAAHMQTCSELIL